LTLAAILAIAALISGGQPIPAGEAEKTRVRFAIKVKRVVLLDKEPVRGPGGVPFYQIGFEFEELPAFLLMGTATTQGVILLNGQPWMPGRVSSRGLIPMRHAEALDAKRKMLRGWAPLPQKGNIEVLAGLLQLGSGKLAMRQAFVDKGVKPYVADVEKLPFLPEAALPDAEKQPGAEKQPTAEKQPAALPPRKAPAQRTHTWAPVLWTALGGAALLVLVAVVLKKRSSRS